MKMKSHLSRISPTPDVCAFSRVTITPLASWIPVKCQPALVHPISPFAVIYLPERAQMEATNAHVFASQTIRGCINYDPTWWSSHHWECWWTGGWILRSSARSSHHEEEPPVQMLNMISWSSSSLKREVMIDPISKSAKLSASASGRPDPQGEVRWSEEYAWPTQRGRQVGAPQQIWISPEKNTLQIPKYQMTQCITVI